MKKSVGLIFGFLAMFVFGACSASKTTTAPLLTIQSTETMHLAPSPTQPFIPTVDPLTPSAVADSFHTLEATTVTPEPTTAPTYEECSQWNELTADKNWALCDPRTDPITLINGNHPLKSHQ